MADYSSYTMQQLLDQRRGMQASPARRQITNEINKRSDAVVPPDTPKLRRQVLNSYLGPEGFLRLPEAEKHVIRNYYKTGDATLLENTPLEEIRRNLLT